MLKLAMLKWGMLRLLPVMALAGVILLAQADPAPVQAQATTSLVSSYHSGRDGFDGVGFTILTIGQRFRTGPESAILDRVAFELSNVSNNAELNVSIHEAETSGFPKADPLHTLTSPTTLRGGNRKNHFMAPDGAVLEGESDYVVVIHASSGSAQVNTTLNPDELDGKAHGWSIADDALLLSINSGNWGTSTRAQKMDVIGELIPLERIEVGGRFLRTLDSQDQLCWDDYEDRNNNVEPDEVCGNWVTIGWGSPQQIFIAENEWSPAGLWSDGATMWVGDPLHATVHALDLGELRQGVVKLDKGRTVQLHPQEALLQQARALQRSEAFAGYRQRRVVVEHRLARLVQLGIRQARYFGRAKTRFQLYLAATVANLTLVAAKAGLTGDIGNAAIGGRAAGTGGVSATFAAIFGAIRLTQIWSLALLTPAFLPKALFSTRAFHPHF